jgi:hypothetical protein
VTKYLFATSSPSEHLFSTGFPGRPKILAFCHTTRRPANAARFNSLPLSILAPLEDHGEPTVVLGPSLLSTRISTRRLACAGTSSSRIALGSLPCRATSARSDLAPKSFLLFSDDFLITTSRSSGLPLSQISSRERLLPQRLSHFLAYA